MSSSETLREIVWGRAAALYLSLYVIITFPLVLRPHELVIATHGDGFNDMLWFWYAATGRVLQPHTQMLFYPSGASLGADQGYWFVPYLSVPLQTIMPLPLVFNALSAAFFVATATALYALARVTGASAGGAWLGGALLVLSPPYLEELGQGILEQTSLQWLIGFVLCGVVLKGAEPVAPIRWSLRAGTCLVAAVLTSWYNAIFAAMFCVILPLRRLAPGLVMAALLLALPLVFGARQVQEHTMRYDAAQVHQRVAPVPGRGSTATVAPFQPTDDVTSLLGDSVDYSLLFTRSRLVRSDALPGILLLALVALGAWRLGARAAPWIALCAGFAVFSLGPHLTWRGQDALSLPTEWLYVYIPQLLRVRPHRFLLPLLVVLSLLAAHSVPTIRRRWLLAATVGILLGLQMFEMRVVHDPSYALPLVSAKVPDFYRRVHERDTGALVEMPLFPIGVQVGKNHFYQTVHQRPMLNYSFIRPYLMKRLRAMGEENSVVGMLMDPSVRPRREDAVDLQRRGFRYVILHSAVDALPARLKEDALQMFSGPVFDALRALYGEPRDEGDGLLVFDMHNVVEREAGVARPFERGQDAWMLGLDRVGDMEVRAWMRGRGAHLVLVQHGSEVAASPSLVDDLWHWVRIKVTGGKAGELRLEVRGMPRDGTLHVPELWTP